MPILKAAFPNVAEETLREIVGPLDKFSATEAIARARKIAATTEPKKKDEAEKKDDQSGADALADAFAKILAESMAEELQKGEPHE